jgi:hypothetical protein
MEKLDHFSLREQGLKLLQIALKDPLRMKFNNLKILIRAPKLQKSDLKVIKRVKWSQVYLLTLNYLMALKRR